MKSALKLSGAEKLASPLNRPLSSKLLIQMEI
jgi:hypothetical protein